MKELVEAVRTYGKGIGTDIVKVDLFLNHRLDTNLLVKMGQAFADVFACEKPDLVLTIEALSLIHIWKSICSIKEESLS